MGDETEKPEWVITPSDFYKEALVQPPGHFRNQAVRFGKQMKYMEAEKDKAENDLKATLNNSAALQVEADGLNEQIKLLNRRVAELRDSQKGK